ncbi:MAG: NfeD family protein [Termitinemataceae bacterium]
MDYLVWLSIGIVLMALEAIVPGFIIFWFGVAGVIIAMLTWWGFLSSLDWQILIFFISAGLMLGLWFGLFARYFRRSEPRDITISGQRGRVVTPLSPGQVGEIELYDAINGIKRWRAIADEVLSVDTEIEVIEAVGIKFKVRSVQ